MDRPDDEQIGRLEPAVGSLLLADIDPVRCGHLTGFDIVDYGDTRGRGCLIASGAGIMMSIMDSCSSIRWCCDIDHNRAASATDLAVLLSSRVSMIGLAGWFSVDKPDRFQKILDLRLPCPVLAYGGNVNLGYATLAQWLSAARSMAPTCSVAP